MDRVRVASLQYFVRPVTTFEQFRDQVVGLVGTAADYKDPTLTFQLRNGFHVLAVVGDYLRHDSESLGYAAIIEWLNPAVAKPEDYPRHSGFR